MKRIIIPILLLVLTSGCGTVMARSNKELRSELPRVYPATTLDAQIIARPFSSAEKEGNCGMKFYANLAACCFAPVGIIDLPFSIVTDTILLPFDILFGKKEEEIQQTH